MKRVLLPTAVPLLVLGLVCFISWQRSLQAQKVANITAGFEAAHQQARAQMNATEADNDRLERAIEADYWDSARELRGRRAKVAGYLADEQKTTPDSPAIAADRAALARIDARLKVLAAQ